MKKRALITGGSSGIGFALAKEFAVHEYDLILVARDHEELKRVQGIIIARYGVSVTSIPLDLAEERAPQKLYDQIHKRDLQVDILVNDAGAGMKGLFNDIPVEEYMSSIRLNVEAPTILTKLFLEGMLIRKEGKILNVESVAGFQPGPLMSVYHATKAYVVSLSESLAEELKDTGVTITCLCPGPTDTSFFEKARMENTHVAKHGNLMSPEEVAKIAYEGLMTGDVIVIPGAMNKVMNFTRRFTPIELQARINKKFYEEEIPEV